MVYEKAKGQRGREYVKGTKTETVVVVGTLSPSTSQQPPLSRGVVAPSANAVGIRMKVAKMSKGVAHF
ncbi:hypothetical protein QQP08_027333 [Theobroma cacao]|nr:hypothetical protein QQP08_027333 [Theobroma cacao]